MKKTLIAFLALAGGLTASKAQFAANYLAPVDQDLIFAVIKINDNNAATGTVLQYNLGNSAFLDSTGHTANIASDLSTAFGAGWATDSSLHFALLGADGTPNSLWVGIASTSTFIPQRQSSVGQSQAANNMDLLYVLWDNGTATGSGLGKSISAGDDASLGKYVDATGVNGIFNGSYALSSVITGTNNIFSLAPGNGNGSQIGSVSLASDGTVTVVPEPSTYALLGFGALLLIMAYRRKGNA